MLERCFCSKFLRVEKWFQVASRTRSNYLCKVCIFRLLPFISKKDKSVSVYIDYTSFNISHEKYAEMSRKLFRHLHILILTGNFVWILHSISLSFVCIKTIFFSFDIIFLFVFLIIIVNNVTFSTIFIFCLIFKIAKTPMLCVIYNSYIWQPS